MLPAESHDGLRIFTPVGQFGQGWDSAPLALGKTAASPAGYKRDFGEVVKAAHTHGVQCLIGSAGGSGSNALVDMSTQVIKVIIAQNGYRTMKVISIYAEIDKELVRDKFRSGLVSQCGKDVPAPEDQDIDQAVRIVAQMGIEPYRKAMDDRPDFDIIIGGRAYHPAPYAAFCLHRGYQDLDKHDSETLNYAMRKIMECGAQLEVPKSRECLVIVRHDCFDLVSLQPGAKCTTISVPAHLLYEQSRPDILQGPGGELHTKNITYEQLDERTVRVRGGKFVSEPEGGYTVKAEATRLNGAQTSVVGAFRDPILIAQLQHWIPAVKEGFKRRMSTDYAQDSKITMYGINGIMGSLECDKSLSKEVCIVVQCRATT